VTRAGAVGTMMGRAIVSGFPDDFRLLLASRSPRRSELLTAVGIPFEVVPSDAEEELCGDSPDMLTERNALAKARAASLPADTLEGTFVLGVDTVVVVDGSVLGKPADPEAAREMLERLSGRSHDVVSGVALLRVAEDGPRVLSTRIAGAEHVASALTQVTFKNLSMEQISAHVTSGEWADKAGGYAIQGLAALFVEGIVGEYANVVGLPLALMGTLFRREGFDVVTRSWIA